MPLPQQPIVILGGFLISPETAETDAPMVSRLEQLSGQPVRLVAVGKAEWLLTSVAGDLDLATATPTARRLAPTAYCNSMGDAHDRGEGSSRSARLGGAPFAPADKRCTLACTQRQ